MFKKQSVKRIISLLLVLSFMGSGNVFALACCQKSSLQEGRPAQRLNEQARTHDVTLASEQLFSRHHHHIKHHEFHSDKLQAYEDDPLKRGCADHDSSQECCQACGVAMSATIFALNYDPPMFIFDKHESAFKSLSHIPLLHPPSK